jgi:hypothetical protein
MASKYMLTLFNDYIADIFHRAVQFKIRDKYENQMEE